MTIKIAITNLGIYNEGGLAYEWLELPYENEELNNVLEKIGINEQYEEYFISDYEAPFPIHEYENIDKLNEFAKVLEIVDIPQANEYNFYDVEEVINFINELENENLIQDSHEYIGDIIDNEQLDEMVKNMIDNSNGWLRVKIVLSEANHNSDYHLLDGYENVVRLNNKDLKNIVSDALEEVQDNL